MCNTTEFWINKAWKKSARSVMFNNDLIVGVNGNQTSLCISMILKQKKQTTTKSVSCKHWSLFKSLIPTPPCDSQKPSDLSVCPAGVDTGHALELILTLWNSNVEYTISTVFLTNHFFHIWTYVDVDDFFLIIKGLDFQKVNSATALYPTFKTNHKKLIKWLMLFFQKWHLKPHHSQKKHNRLKEM